MESSNVRSPRDATLAAALGGAANYRGDDDAAVLHLEAVLMRLHDAVETVAKNVDCLKEQVRAANLSPATLAREPSLIRAKRDLEDKINSLLSELESARVPPKGNPFYSQLKRMLAARLATLEIRARGLERRETLQMQHDPQCQELANIEKKLNSLCQEVETADIVGANGIIGGGSAAAPAAAEGGADAAKNTTFGFWLTKKREWTDDLNRLTESLDDLVGLQNSSIRELASRKKTIYTKLDLLETLIAQRVSAKLSDAMGGGRDDVVGDGAAAATAPSAAASPGATAGMLALREKMSLSNVGGEDVAVAFADKNLWWIAKELCRLEGEYRTAVTRGDTREAAAIAAYQNDLHRVRAPRGFHG